MKTGVPGLSGTTSNGGKTMRNYLFAALLGAGLLGVPMLTGCDPDKATSSKTETTVHSDGSTTTDKQTTTTDPNGTKTTTEHNTAP
jgi:hypothetical protein